MGLCISRTSGGLFFWRGRRGGLVCHLLAHDSCEPEWIGGNCRGSLTPHCVDADVLLLLAPNLVVEFFLGEEGEGERES